MSSGKREQHAGERRVPGAGKAAAARLAVAVALLAALAAASPAAAGDAAAGLELAGEDVLAAAAAAAAAFWACRSLSRWMRAAAHSRIVFSVGGDILAHDDISKTGLYYRVSSDSLQIACGGRAAGEDVGCARRAKWLKNATAARGWRRTKAGSTNKTEIAQILSA